MNEFLKEENDSDDAKDEEVGRDNAAHLGEADWGASVQLGFGR